MRERRTAARQLDEIQLLALLGPRHMRGDERVHERLEIRAPPLRQRVADLPLVVDALAGKLRADGRQALVEARLEALDLVVLGAQIVPRQLEEGVRDLQHQDVRVVVLVADEDGFRGAPHAMLVVVLFEALQAREHRGVFLWLPIFGAEGVVAERVEADCLGLVGVEVLGQDGAVACCQHMEKGNKNRQAPYGYELCEAFCVIVDMALALLSCSCPSA